MPFPCRLPRRPLQHRAKATSVFVRRTFSYISPCGNKVPEGLQRGEGLAGFHPPFPCRLPRRPLQHRAKATSVFVRRTFSYISPCGNKVPEGLQRGEGLAGFHPPFPCRLPRRPLQHRAKATSVFVRRTFSYISPLRKQSSRGAYIRKKPNLKLGFCLCCGERGIRKAKPSRGHISKNNPYLATQPPLRENPLEKAAAGIAAFCCGTERPSCCSDDLLETKKRQTSVCHCGRFRLAEREALEPTYSRNIIKLQIINNQALFGVHSKSKSF